jgi:hypothetical protein
LNLKLEEAILVKKFTFYQGQGSFVFIKNTNEQQWLGLIYQFFLTDYFNCTVTTVNETKK